MGSGNVFKKWSSGKIYRIDGNQSAIFIFIMSIRSEFLGIPFQSIVDSSRKLARIKSVRFLRARPFCLLTCRISFCLPIQLNEGCSPICPNIAHFSKRTPEFSRVCTSLKI
jgi:hypothetical protein